MASGLNKERALFLAGTVLFAWVMLKFGLYWRRELQRPGTPKVPAATIQLGDPNIRDQLAIPNLAHYTERGSRNPFFSDVSQPAGFYVRTVVRHSFGPTAVRSRYTFDCRMAPTPVSEVRFRLPPRTTISQVYSNEIDPKRLHGRQGRIYIVPVKPVEEKRSYYRCQITLVTQSMLDKLPTKWVAPIVSCTGAMEKVASESGHLALAAPGSRVELIPLNEDRAKTGLERVVENQWPKEFSRGATKAVYHFAKPEYELTLELRRAIGGIAVKPKPPTVRPKPPTVRPEPPVVKPEPPKIGPKPEPKLAIPKPDAEARPPLKVMLIYRKETAEPRRQAVLRHKETGEYYRKFEGDTVLDGLKIAKITDDTVIIFDPKRNKHFTLRGRFAGQYEE